MIIVPHFSLIICRLWTNESILQILFPRMVTLLQRFQKVSTLNLTALSIHSQFTATSQTRPHLQTNQCVHARACVCMNTYEHCTCKKVQSINYICQPASYNFQTDSHRNRCKVYVGTSSTSDPFAGDLPRVPNLPLTLMVHKDKNSLSLPDTGYQQSTLSKLQAWLHKTKEASTMRSTLRRQLGRW